MKMSKVREVIKIITGIGLTDTDKKVFHNVKKMYRERFFEYFKLHKNIKTAHLLSVTNIECGGYNQCVMDALSDILY